MQSLNESLCWPGDLCVRARSTKTIFPHICQHHTSTSMSISLCAYTLTIEPRKRRTPKPLEWFLTVSCVLSYVLIRKTQSKKRSEYTRTSAWPNSIAQNRNNDTSTAYTLLWHSPPFTFRVLHFQCTRATTCDMPRKWVFNFNNVITEFTIRIALQHTATQRHVSAMRSRLRVWRWQNCAYW